MARPGVFTFGYFRGGLVTNLKASANAAVYPVPVKPAITRAGTNVVLKWQGYSGATYRVLSSTNATAPSSGWTELYRVSAMSYAVISFTNSLGSQRRFYGIKEEWP